MKLDKTILQEGRALQGYALPRYDRQAMVRRTQEAPTWLHFGAGNIFRMFPAALCQRLLNAGEWDTGIVCCEGYDGEIVTKSLRPYDNLTVAVSLLADGSMEKEIVGSIGESLTLPQDSGRVGEIFRQPSLQMVSFTITEKGYAVTGGVQADMTVPPQQAKTFLAQLVAFCLDRFEACAAPLALVSLDNCSHNGEKLRGSFFQILDAWKAAGYVTDEAYAYAQEKLSFPWSMIDKITPRPHESVQQALEADGLEGMDILVTEKHTYTSAFVNAEKPQYLVIEDDFPAGRPPLEKAGVLFTDRDTVNAVESMKVCTCLNPLHTALAIFGCLLGHTTIAGEMEDPGSAGAGHPDEPEGGNAGGDRPGSDRPGAVPPGGADPAVPQSVYAGHAPADRDGHLPKAAHPVWRGSGAPPEEGGFRPAAADALGAGRMASVLKRRGR